MLSTTNPDCGDSGGKNTKDLESKITFSWPMAKNLQHNWVAQSRTHIDQHISLVSVDALPTSLQNLWHKWVEAPLVSGHFPRAGKVIAGQWWVREELERSKAGIRVSGWDGWILAAVMHTGILDPFSWPDMPDWHSKHLQAGTDLRRLTEGQTAVREISKNVFI